MQDKKNLKQTVIEFEKNLIVLTYEACNKNMKLAAEMLGIQRPTLFFKMQRLGIHEPKKKRKHEQI